MSYYENTKSQIHYRDAKHQNFRYEQDAQNSQNTFFIDQKNNNFFSPDQSKMPRIAEEFRNHFKDPNYISRKPRMRYERPFPRSIPLSCVRPGSVRPSEAQLDLAFAYGIRRHDGSVTRLIRADQINTPFMNPRLPRWQSEEGLIILPEPRQLSPDRRGGCDPIISQQKIRDLNQSIMPNILKASTGDSNQIQIDKIINTRPKESAATPQRRKKVYCDKWVHEGICAFTQIGCKFKHEMPTDKETQIAVGLNHGFPNWYLRLYGQKVNLCSEPTFNYHHTRPTDDTWRHQSSTLSQHVPLTPRKPALRTAFGPIRPPPSLTHLSCRSKVSSSMNKNDTKLDIYDV